jgi:hypothetical protein
VKAAVMASTSAGVAGRAETGPEGLVTRPMLAAGGGSSRSAPDGAGGA